MKSKLIFVYNADSGLFSKLTDFAHKKLSPDTYQCNLCFLTYGDINMKESWREFINALPLSTSFLHKDEFHKLYHELKHTELPAVFLSKIAAFNQIITAKEINACDDLEQLMDLVRKRILT